MKIWIPAARKHVRIYPVSLESGDISFLKNIYGGGSTSSANPDMKFHGVSDLKSMIVLKTFWNVFWWIHCMDC